VTGGTITAILGGSGSTLTKSGAGTTTLSGVNTYTGGTAINGGVLRISSRDNFANRLLSFDGGTLEATTNISGFTSANNTTLNAGGGTIRVGNGVIADWGSAKLTGTGALTKEGTGTLVIASGAVVNDYSGGTFLNEGVLSISRATALGTNTSTVTFNGGILESTASITTARATTLNASGGTFEVASGTTNTWNGAIGGLGSLNKSGSGALVIGGNGGYSGTTTVSAGSLIVGATGSVGGSSVLDVSSGATLDVSAVTSGFVVGSSQSLRGGGTVVGNITVDGILAPGNSIGTLTTVGDVTWNAGNSWIFELGGAGPSIGSPGTSDLLTVGGDFLRGSGSGSAWTFDFAGTGAFGWYKLAEWSGTSDFEVLNFSGVNLGSGFDSEFAIQDSALYVNVVPEPSTYMLLLLAGAGLGIRILRRREA
jgi:fibronectin-binding autotransporter adhesin